MNQYDLDNHYKDDLSTNFDSFYNPGGVGGSKRESILSFKQKMQGWIKILLLNSKFGHLKIIRKNRIMRISWMIF